MKELVNWCIDYTTKNFLKNVIIGLPNSQVALKICSLYYIDACKKISIEVSSGERVKEFYYDSDGNFTHQNEYKKITIEVLKKIILNELENPTSIF